MMDDVQKAFVRKLCWLFFFFIWMAYIESAVVVYLRGIYYPDGFSFPIQIIPIKMSVIEVGREAATIFILLSIAFLAGKTKWSRFAYFMIGFGSWDIWYYIWLKIFLNWPESFFTWDVLFLIPVIWTGPVIAPLIVSVSLIFGGFCILHFENRNLKIQLTRLEWIALISAAVIIFISFILEAPRVLKNEVPRVYHYELLFIGEIMGLAVLYCASKRILRQFKN